MVGWWENDVIVRRRGRTERNTGNKNNPTVTESQNIHELHLSKFSSKKNCNSESCQVSYGGAVSVYQTAAAATAL